MDAQIASHPLGSDRVRAAHRIIEECNRDEDSASRELERMGLPSLQELGLLQVRHTLSWWRLHRKRKILIRRLARLHG
ncbi:hypothetical protein BW737_006820 [Actinomyces ruminis]|uniref:Peptidase family M48 n=1 Tax=Actinomyces ruminis TaxID=1937003 RepID=A0ABX4MFD6_9ACTO|nr:hypothetical protein BW737_006820 [Actinomyces ruminis]